MIMFLNLNLIIMKNYVMFDEQYFNVTASSTSKFTYHLYNDYGIIDEVYKLRSYVYQKIEKFFDEHFDLDLILDIYFPSSFGNFVLYRRLRFCSQRFLDELKDGAADVDIQVRLKRMNAALPSYIKQKCINHGVPSSLFTPSMD